SLFDAGHALHLAGMAHQAVAVARYHDAGNLVADVARIVPEGDHAPAAGTVGVAEAQGRERNPDLDLVAAGRDPAGAGPQAVPGRILVVGRVLADQVHLHAQRADEDFRSEARRVGKGWRA